MKTYFSKETNPIPELISDKDYQAVYEVLDHTALRDHVIQARYKALVKANPDKWVHEHITALCKEYKVQPDTMKKIVYKDADRPRRKKAV